MDKENFSKWLQHQLDLREWSQADLSRKSGVSTGQIARLMTGERGIGEQSVIAIAKALKIPPVHVLEAAGILPANKDSDPWVEKMNVTLNNIKDPASRALAERVLESLISGPPEVAVRPSTKKVKGNI
jgi:transcriptional regulator with XRE-family HTH domain